MRLGLYGGTFDPIHHGHLILARAALEQFALDRVIFIPAARSPHKQMQASAPPSVRADLIAAAIAGEPAFELERAETLRPGPSFTIETVEAIQARVPNAVLFYFIGADNLAELPTWRRVDDLHRLAQFVVFSRGSATPTHGFPALNLRIDISATELRRRVALGASIRYLVPESVRALIASHHLYQELAPSNPNL